MCVVRRLHVGNSLPQVAHSSFPFTPQRPLSMDAAREGLLGVAAGGKEATIVANKSGRLENIASNGGPGPSLSGTRYFSFL